MCKSRIVRNLTSRFGDGLLLGPFAFCTFLLSGCQEEPKFTMPEQKIVWDEGVAPQVVSAGPSATAMTGTDGRSDVLPSGLRSEQANVNLDIPIRGGRISGALAVLPMSEFAEEMSQPPAINRQSRAWPMLGGAPDRNMVSSTTGVTLDFDLSGQRVLWKANLDAKHLSTPVYSGGKLVIGTSGVSNNLICFDATNGTILWQLPMELAPVIRPESSTWKLPATPVIEGERLWVFTNNGKIQCLDLNGFHDGTDDGQTDEGSSDVNNADIIWSIDLNERFPDYAQHLCPSSPLLHGDILYFCVGISDHFRSELPAELPPNFIGLHKESGDIVFKDGNSTNCLFEGQWGAPCLGTVRGMTQVIFSGRDGWLYAYDVNSHTQVWKCDLNPKDAAWGPTGERNNVFGTPVFHEDSVIVAVGRHPDAGDGPGRLLRIDATGKADLSYDVGTIGSASGLNRNNGVRWQFGGKEGETPVFGRSLASVSIHHGMVFAVDLRGVVYCLDFETGEKYWQHDLQAKVFGSPLYVDGKLLVGDQAGRLNIFPGSRDYALKRHGIDAEIATLNKSIRETSDQAEIRNLKSEIELLVSSVAPVTRSSSDGASIDTSPTIASGVLYIATQSQLIAIQATKQ